MGGQVDDLACARNGGDAAAVESIHERKTAALIVASIVGGATLAGAAPGLRSLHIVGTSAGSFAADAMASAYVRAREGRQRAGVRLSLADPFTARDGDDFNTGRARRICGREAESYMAIRPLRRA